MDPVHNSVTFKSIGSDHATVAMPRKRILERIPAAFTFGAVNDG